MVSMLVAAVAAAAAPSHLLAESQHFELLTDGGEAEARATLTALEEAHAVLTHEIGPAPWSRIRVHSFATRAALQSFPPMRDGRPVMDMRGYTTAEGGKFLIVFSSAEMPRSHQHVAAIHELVHVFLAYRYPRLPPWCEEGLAEHLSHMDVDVPVVRFRKTYAPLLTILRREGLLPMEEVLAATSTREGDEPWRDRFYAQSWALVSYLERSPSREGSLARLLEEIGEGRDARDAFRARVEDDLPALAGELSSWLRRAAGDPPPSLTIPGIAPARHVTVRRPGAVQVDAWHARLALANRDAERARRLARRAGASAEAHSVLAQIALDSGDVAEALREAALAIALDPCDARAHAVAADALLQPQAADTLGRRPTLPEIEEHRRAAHRADPTLPPVRHDLALLLLARGLEIPEALDLARGLVAERPADAQAHLMLARAEREAGMLVEAGASLRRAYRLASDADLRRRIASDLAELRGPQPP